MKGNEAVLVQKQIRLVEANIKKSFTKVREEMDVHLDSINANTQEINANYDHIIKLENRLDKIEEKLDNLNMFISNLVKDTPIYDEKSFGETSLTVREQEVFLVLYTANDKKLTFNDIAKKLALTNEIVEKTVDSLIHKKVPITKVLEDNSLFIYLEENFRDFQTKKNALNISEHVSKSLISN